MFALTVAQPTYSLPKSISKRFLKGDRFLVKRVELEKWLIEYLGVTSANDFLPNGLQIEGTEEIKKIVTAVSVNLDIVKAALLQQADTIIVHHGMFWNSDEKTIRGYRKFRIRQILAHNLNLFAFHLPLDLHPEISHNRLILMGLRADKIIALHDSGDEYTIGIKGIYNNSISLCICYNVCCLVINLISNHRSTFV